MELRRDVAAAVSSLPPSEALRSWLQDWKHLGAAFYCVESSLQELLGPSSGAVHLHEWFGFVARNWKHEMDEPESTVDISG